MTPHDLLANFATLAEAPNGVQRLRELVLELAVRGKLVEQDPLDEPSGALLERIRSQSASSGQHKKLGSKGKSSSATPEEGPYEVPSSWLWVRLKDVADYNGRPNLDPSEICSDIWVLDLEDIEKDSSRILQRLTNATRQSRSTKSSFCKGDVLYGKLRPYLNKVVVADQNGVCTTEIVPIVPAKGLDSGFLRLLLKRPGFLDYANQLTYGVKMPRLGTSDAEESLHPLPPTNEQCRIVARVDELMALLDHLEAKRQEREAARTAARDSALAALLEAPTLEDVEVAWLRIQGHFTEFLGCPEDVEFIKKMVFQLAITGRLARQDPSDESIQKLFTRIEAERIQYSKSSSFRGTAPLAIDPAKIPFPIPTGWRWARLGSIFKAITDGDHLPPPRSEDGIAFLTIGNITSGALDFTDCRQVQESYFQDIADFRRPSRGDILYTVVGATYGRPALVTSDRPFCVQRHIAILKPPREVDAEFLMVLLRSPFVYDQASSSTTGTAQPTVPLGALRNFLVPIPPLAEQGRILKKVGDLMVNLDRLAACHFKIRTDWEAFASAAVHHLDN